MGLDMSIYEKEYETELLYWGKSWVIYNWFAKKLEPKTVTIKDGKKYPINHSMILELKKICDTIIMNHSLSKILLSESIKYESENPSHYFNDLEITSRMIDRYIELTELCDEKLEIYFVASH